MRLVSIRAVALAALLAVPAALIAQQPQGAAPGGGQGRGGGRGPAAPPLLMTTTAFEDGGIIPAKYAGGMGVSPELKWSQVPMGTQSFVLLMHDPDVALQRGTGDVTHWIIWNIPGTATGLPEGVPAGAELPDGSRQVSLRASGYMGPGAPATGPYHHYTFELFALDTKLEVPAGTPQEAAATRAAIMKGIEGHALGKAVLVGRFHQ
jgi:Raf kinase inhibitor-like YbhB/YbcL family protein